MSPDAQPVEHDTTVFGPDPTYGEKPYDYEAQLDIYGGKSAVPTPRPLLELGRPQYQSGPFREGTNVLGAKNLSFGALSVYGDWRTAVAFNDNGDRDVGLIATRLNLDVDVKLTSTERIHAFFRPLDDNGNFSRCEFAGDVFDGSGQECKAELDAGPNTLFFEGDLGSILSGFSGKFSKLDLPVAAGLMPLLFQNGVWFEDAVTGFAFSIPARNSRALDISNFDLTFFAAFDQVNNGGVIDPVTRKVRTSDVNIYGFAGFFETRGGYLELDYAYIDDHNRFGGFDASHHNLSAAWSWRFRHWFSASLRVVWNFGQEKPLAGSGFDHRTANGVLVVWESSLITSKPLTLVPYINLFVGIDRPQSVARDNGGILKNIGINFETDALTGFPKLDDTGHDTFGGAIGVSYLFDLDQQLVFEIATVQTHGSPIDRKAKGGQYAVGVRYQRPISKSVILRADVIAASLEGEADLLGARFEVRVKF